MFDKLDAYNLVANLIPGAALIYALHYSGFPAPEPSSVLAFLLISFVAGVTTNRLGSLALDPVLRCEIKIPLRQKKWRVLHPKNYKAFVTSEKTDKKLETIVANTGLYRTFFTAGLVYFVLLFANAIVMKFSVPRVYVFSGAIIVGMVIFFFAFRKEDNYIHERLSAKDRDEPR